MLNYSQKCHQMIYKVLPVVNQTIVMEVHVLQENVSYNQWMQSQKEWLTAEELQDKRGVKCFQSALDLVFQHCFSL